MHSSSKPSGAPRPARFARWVPILIYTTGAGLVAGLCSWGIWSNAAQPLRETVWAAAGGESRLAVPLTSYGPLAPRQYVDTGGFNTVIIGVSPWGPTASLQEIRDRFVGQAGRSIADIDGRLETPDLPWQQRLSLVVVKAGCLLSEGQSAQAYALLESTRQHVERDGGEVRRWTLLTLVFFQGVAALRLGEDENCILCRGESSCILPISGAAVHQFPKGSRLAAKHFLEYLEVFPDDLEVRWLLNLAHMTLGEHPHLVDPRFLIRLDHFLKSQAGIGKFRDIGHLVGLNRLNQAGGCVMDDFDNDGLLDLAVTSFDPSVPLALYRNTGDGRFAENPEAGLDDQLGGLVCVQTDYNNDGRIDLYIPRGAWLSYPVRPSLLRNDGDFRFTDVTAAAGLLDPLNSNAAAWADFDNDGWLDLFVCCEMQDHRLYRNLGNGRFQDVAAAAGLAQFGSQCKGCTWIDYDNDDYPDLFVNDLGGTAQLFHNERNGKFAEVTDQLGIDGPAEGFSCWAWDYNNDGWLDLFATSYDRNVGAVVQGLLGQPHNRHSNRLLRNVGGQRFENVTAEAGLDLVFATMGSNYGDFDNDGFLDMYLGTGEPNLSALVPNRMFRNLAGRNFAEITASAGVGHLQKGHAVAAGDWDRNGNLDVFIQMGGPINGDKYHNILFQNPGNDHSWLCVKLVGKRTNRAALGARIKVVTAGDKPLTIHRHISPGSSFGGNPLEQTIGLAGAEKVATLEIHWPTSGTTQVFHDLAVNQAIEVVELSDSYRKLDRQPISLPETDAAE
jgi:hypothetical protein